MSHRRDGEAPVLGRATTVAYGLGGAARLRSGCRRHRGHAASSARLRQPLPTDHRGGSRVPAWAAGGSERGSAGDALASAAKNSSAACPSCKPCACRCQDSSALCNTHFIPGLLSRRCFLPWGKVLLLIFSPESSPLLCASPWERWPYLGLCQFWSPSKDVAPGTQVTHHSFYRPDGCSRDAAAGCRCLQSVVCPRQPLAFSPLRLFLL